MEIFLVEIVDSTMVRDGMAMIQNFFTTKKNFLESGKSELGYPRSLKLTDTLVVRDGEE